MNGDINYSPFEVSRMAQMLSSLGILSISERLCTGQTMNRQVKCGCQRTCFSCGDSAVYYRERGLKIVLNEFPSWLILLNTSLKFLVCFFIFKRSMITYNIIELLWGLIVITTSMLLTRQSQRKLFLSPFSIICDNNNRSRVMFPPQFGNYVSWELTQGDFHRGFVIRCSWDQWSLRKVAKITYFSEIWK